MTTDVLQAADAMWNAKRLASIAREVRDFRFPLTRLRDIEPDLDGDWMVEGLLQRAA